MRRETYFPQLAITRAITPKLYTYSNPRFFENSRLRIEIRATPSSIAHAALSDVSLPAVSSFGGLRTPAPVYVASSSWAGIRKPSQYRSSARYQTFIGSADQMHRGSIERHNPTHWLSPRVMQ